MAIVADDRTELLVTGREGAVQRLVLSGERVVVGRGDDVGVKLADNTVSRRHAELYRDPFGRWWVHDLGSHNKTLVNGGEIVEEVVGPSDVIQIGACLLRLRPVGGGTTVMGASGGTRTMASRQDEALSAIRSLAEMRAPKIGTEQLSAVVEFGQGLLEVIDAAGRLESLCRVLLGEGFGGTYAMILRLGERVGKADVEVLCEACGEGFKEGDEPYVSGSLLAAVRERRQPVVSSNVGGSGDGVSLEMTMVPGAKPLGILACPLEEGVDGVDGGDAGSVDVLYVLVPPQRATAEWLALSRLAVRMYRGAEATVASRERAVRYAQLEQELSRAEKLQRGLVPKKTGIVGMETAIGFEPCRWVGGDFVDAMVGPDGRVLLLIADVCGKGLDAALVSASLHTTLRTGIRAGIGLEALMSCLNEQLVESLPGDRFVTMMALSVDPGSGEVELVNAGHMPPLVLKHDGGVEEMGMEVVNMPLGVMEGRMRAVRAEMRIDDVMLLFTDGLSELADECDKMLGTAGLSGMYTEAAEVWRAGGEGMAGDLEGLADELHRRLKKYCGAAAVRDDMTYLLARRVKV